MWLTYDMGEEVNDKFRIDSTKIMFHPMRVAQLITGNNQWNRVKDIYPLYVEVSPVGHCNHACTFCAIDYVIEDNKANKRSAILDHNMFATRIAEMSGLGVRSVMFAGEGEPMLHKHINDMVFECWDNQVDCSFTTNGTLLHRLADLNKCTWIKVSLNAGTKETYAKVHRTKEKDWDIVWDNIRAAVLRKGDCTVGVQMVLLPENEHEAPLLQKLCDDAGVDYLVLKPFSQHKFSINKNYEAYRPSRLSQSGRVLVRAESIETKVIPYEKCHATPYLWAYLMSTGDVYSCSAYLLDDRFLLGNLNTQTFRDVWHSDRRRANWNYVRNDLDIKDCRVNCRMDKANRYLDDLEKGVPHVNFI